MVVSAVIPYEHRHTAVRRFETHRRHCRVLQWRADAAVHPIGVVHGSSENALWFLPGGARLRSHRFGSQPADHVNWPLFMSVHLHRSEPCTRAFLTFFSDNQQSKPAGTSIKSTLCLARKERAIHFAQFFTVILNLLQLIYIKFSKLDSDIRHCLDNHAAPSEISKWRLIHADLCQIILFMDDIYAPLAIFFHGGVVAGFCGETIRFIEVLLFNELSARLVDSARRQMFEFSITFQSLCFVREALFERGESIRVDVVREHHAKPVVSRDAHFAGDNIDCRGLPLAEKVHPHS